MSIQLTCPSGHTLTIPDAWAGRSGRCPVCKAPVQVPAVSLECGPGAPGSPLSVSHTAALNKEPGSAAVQSKSEPSTRIAAPNQRLQSRPTAPGSPLAIPDPPVQSTDTPPPLPVLLHNGPAAVPSAVLSVAAVPTPTIPIQSTPPPLPVVVATSYATVSAPAAGSLPRGNGSRRLAPPQPLARSNQDAVFANIDTVLDLRPRSELGVRSDASATAIVADIEMETAASSPAAATLSRISFDAPGHSAAGGYQPDADKRRTVYYLAAAMTALSMFCMLPALPHLNLGAAPDWARAALLLSLLQLAYAAWLASVPDWAALRSSMILFTVVAALYGLTMTVTLSTPQGSALPLELTELRRQAVLWCAGVVLLASLLAYGCGRAAWRWRRMLDLLHV
jgi:hypothetical protein